MRTRKQYEHTDFYLNRKKLTQKQQELGKTSMERIELKRRISEAKKTYKLADLNIKSDLVEIIDVIRILQHGIHTPRTDKYVVCPICESDGEIRKLDVKHLIIELIECPACHGRGIMMKR